MDQSDLLLPSSDSGTLDGPLIAFAFLAQATQVEGDLMSRLTPTFKPIVKQGVGRRFDAHEFEKASRLMPYLTQFHGAAPFGNHWADFLTNPTLSTEWSVFLCTFWI